MMDALLLLNVASTLFMVGLIWFVQIVHYPLFDNVAKASFADYELRHSRLTSRVVIPPMLIELGTTIWLVVEAPPAVPAAAAWFGMLLLAIVWTSTFALQVPQHKALLAGFTRRTHTMLVATNWIRTIASSLRGIVVMWMLNRCLA
jgi:uncharacterized membrane protein